MTFPSKIHEKVAQLFAGFCEHRDWVDTVLVVNSCARGRATIQSDLDMAVLVKPGTVDAELEQMAESWRRFAARSPLVAEFLTLGPYSRLHIDYFDGTFIPTVWDEGGGPDALNRNRKQNCTPTGLHAAGPHLQKLRQEWLPYYGHTLRTARLDMVRKACSYDLQHVSALLKRDLHFHAFDRLYKAFQEFLQGVLIARETYPVAYNKWIHEQIVEWLELPDLYDEMLKVLVIGDMEGKDILNNAPLLHDLLEDWVKPITAEQPASH